MPETRADGVYGALHDPWRADGRIVKIISACGDAQSDPGFLSGAPSATRTRDLLLRRHRRLSAVQTGKDARRARAKVPMAVVPLTILASGGLREYLSTRQDLPPPVRRPTAGYTANCAYSGCMSVQREELLRLVEELPEEEVPAVLDDVRRHLRALQDKPWPPSWFGAGESQTTDAAARSEDLLDEGFGRSV
jgi:hypothetical protein